MTKKDVNTVTDALRIDALPTKELFIEMLTRDVALIPAIIDLADNSTDGARRIRGDKTWAGLEVRIEAKPNKFLIKDNCGGIAVDVARHQAFRFGRPVGAVTGGGEVGRFGVGLKRGLFKLGRNFHIQSTTAKSQFEVTINVDTWAQQTAWQFEFDAPPIENKKFDVSDQGTTIVVERLRQEVKEHFQESGFLEELRQELTSKLEQSILNGLAVVLNGSTLKAHTRSLVSDSQLAPAKKSFQVRGRTGGIVDVELWCGLGKPDTQSAARSESGWYVFCNGRMLLEADKTEATAWGVEDNEPIPAYHPQYNGFRGFAYLEADDAADLPWNTTKTALDSDHPVYRRVKQEMVAIARPVVNFFNKKKEENDALKAAGDESKGRLQVMLDDATVKPMEKIKPRPAFIAPAVAIKKKSTKLTQKIIFERPLAKALKVKNVLGVSSWPKVGEEVFDYYYNSECKDA